MTFEKAIYRRYGLTFPLIPDDGLMCSFDLGKLAGGFAIKYKGVGAFGDFLRGEIYAFDGGEVTEINCGEDIDPWHKRPTPSEFLLEKTIIECAKGLIDRGDELSILDLNRFALAISRMSYENAR